MGPKRKAVGTAASFFQSKKLAVAKPTSIVSTSGNDERNVDEDVVLMPGLRWTLNGTLVRAVYTPTNTEEQKGSVPEEEREQTSIPPSHTESETKNAGASSPKRLAIAAFDLDSTLVTTKGRSPFPRDGSDWKWLDTSVRDKLQKLVNRTVVKNGKSENEEFSVNQGADVSTQDASMVDPSTEYVLAIISNQGGVVAENDKKRYLYLKDRVKSIVKDLDTVPLRFYAATKPKKGASDKYRKPLTGMWEALQADLAPVYSVDIEKSFFVGDAAGRRSDFSDSDLKFAQAVGLRFFTPEKFFGLSD
ncbi:Tpp1p [Sugiyamaella lignohabitans]|uniref:Tpp1p n=1 Tax=Sugiyamaella lignohabitans TaxID=796027 RepID=A0A167EBQ7_9ASCO|nr:Tpp1p [Sugiyamaella lignohabitans]ANB13879.1 Tpp1p [Sugiyamaella lignohabitans]